MSQLTIMDLLCRKMFTPHGNLHLRSLPPRTFSFPLTPRLMLCEITDNEEIEERPHNMRMLVEHVTSPLESHFHTPMCSRMVAIRGIQDRQSSVHCLFIHENFLEIKSLSSKGIRIENSRQNLERRYNRYDSTEKEEVRDMA
jgi:hypothetical protein